MSGMRKIVPDAQDGKALLKKCFGRTHPIKIGRACEGAVSLKAL